MVNTGKNKSTVGANGSFLPGKAGVRLNIVAHPQKCDEFTQTHRGGASSSALFDLIRSLRERPQGEPIDRRNRNSSDCFFSEWIDIKGEMI